MLQTKYWTNYVDKNAKNKANWPQITEKWKPNTLKLARMDGKWILCAGKVFLYFVGALDVD